MKTFLMIAYCMISNLLVQEIIASLSSLCLISGQAGELSRSSMEISCNSIIG